MQIAIETLEFILKAISECETIGQVERYGSRAAALAEVVPDIVERCQDALVENKGREVFRITPDGEIEQAGKNITDDDAAVADALREFIRVGYGLHVRPAKR